MYYKKSYNKYGNKKVTFLGETFDSKKEKEQWLILRQQEQIGQIANLQRQVKFVLIPTQYEEVVTFTKTGKEKRTKRAVEYECSYVADFVYTEVSTGEMVVCDVKGFDKKTQKFIETPEFIIKRKLMLFIHGIKIRQV